MRLDLQPTYRGYTRRKDIFGGLDVIPPLNGGARRYTTELGILYNDPSWQALIPFFHKNAAGFFMSNLSDLQIYRSPLGLPNGIENLDLCVFGGCLGILSEF